MTQRSYKTRSGLSHAHERRELRQDNPLNEKARPVKTSFEMERCPLHAAELRDADKSEAERRKDMRQRQQRRESFMVKRQQPKPVLRPSPALAHGPDTDAFDRQWSAEQRAAKAACSDIYRAKAELKLEESNRRKANDLAISGDFDAAHKELFKIKRHVEGISDRALKPGQRFPHVRNED